jgi:hypothetical protein
MKVVIDSQNSVVTECGAMPDLEDREGEVGRVNYFTAEFRLIVFTTDCTS